MKQTITLSTALVFALSAGAQLPVSRTPSNKNALIEEFTGIHCQYCPDGHKRAAAVVAAYPGKVFAVNVHTGTYAPPGAGELDFRTADGDAIASGVPDLKILGYPTGDVNRHVFDTQPMALDRANWAVACPMAMADPAYVNIAGEATLNTTTRVLTINLEAYYTANSPAATNKFTVMLLQDNIIGTQTGASTWNPTMGTDASYRHMHALRDVLTASATGDVISTTTMGTTFTKTITYTIPASVKNIPVKLADLEIIAFVSESSKDIINVCKVPITSGSSVGISENELIAKIGVYPNPAKDNATVNFTLMEPNAVSMVMLNSIGQVVLDEKLGVLSAGEQNYSLHTANLSNGLYLLNIKAGNSTYTRQISIDK